MIDIQKLTADLKRDEGMILHEYKDHLGFSTIGIGRLIDNRRGGGITEIEAEFLLQNDIDRVVRELTYSFPWFTKLSETRQRALCNMCFQLGLGGLKKFKRMINAIEIGHFERARTEALDSTWAKQTPARAVRVANMLRDGR